MTMIAGWGVSPAIVSIALSPLGIVLTLLSSHAGKYADRFGPGPLIAAGSVIVAIAFALMGLTAPLHNVWFVLIPLMTLMGLGMSLVVSPLSTAVMTSLSDKDTGIASGVNNAVARVAGLLAVAIGGGVAAIVFEQSLGPAAEQAIFFGLSPGDAARRGVGSDPRRRDRCGVCGGRLSDGGAVRGVGGDRVVHARKEAHALVALAVGEDLREDSETGTEHRGNEGGDEVRRAAVATDEQALLELDDDRDGHCDAHDHPQRAPGQGEDRERRNHRVGYRHTEAGEIGEPVAAQGKYRAVEWLRRKA